MADEGTAPSTLGAPGGNPSGAAPPSPAGSPSTPTPTSGGERPAYVPESFWDADKRELKTEAAFGELKKLSDASAAAEAARANLPKEAKDYAFTPPEGFKLPEVDGKQAEIDPQHPMWGRLQQFAHAEGLTQEQFSKAGAFGMELLAGQVTAFNKAGADFIKAEEAKLGDNSKARVEAISRFVETNFPQDVAADFAKGGLNKASTAMVIEKLISTLSSNGITAFNGNGRDGGRSDGKPQNWEQMSAVDRLTWSRANQPKTNGASR